MSHIASVANTDAANGTPASCAANGKQLASDGEETNEASSSGELRTPSLPKLS